MTTRALGQGTPMVRGRLQLSDINSLRAQPNECSPSRCSERQEALPARVRFAFLVFLLVLDIPLRAPIHGEVMRLLDRFAGTVLRLQRSFGVENSSSLVGILSTHGEADG